MTKTIAIALIAVAGLTLGACGPSEPPKPPTGGTPGAAPTLVERAMQAAKDAGQAAEAQVRTATAKLESGSKGLSEAVLEKSKGLTDATSEKAAQLIAQTKDAIAANKPEVAQTLMARLELVKGALPDGLKAEVARLEALVAGSRKAP